jgi:hypothetical protein
VATSTEKILRFVEELQDKTDDELATLAPLPVGLMRMAMGAASMRIPNDPALLDEYALGAAQFVLSMRSDDAEPVELLVAGDVVALAQDAEG